MTTDQITEIEQRGTLASSQMIRSDTPFIALTPSERDELCAEARKVEGLEADLLATGNMCRYERGEKEHAKARAESAEQKLRANQLIIDAMRTAREAIGSLVHDFDAEVFHDSAPDSTQIRGFTLGDWRNLRTLLSQLPAPTGATIKEGDETCRDTEGKDQSQTLSGSNAAPAKSNPSQDAATLVKEWRDKAAYLRVNYSLENEGIVEQAHAYDICAAALQDALDTDEILHSHAPPPFPTGSAGQPESADDKLDRIINERHAAGLPVAPETDREARHRAADGPRPKASRDALMESPRTFSVRAEIAAALDEMGTLFRDRKFAVMSLSDCFNNVAAKLRQSDAR